MRPYKVLSSVIVLGFSLAAVAEQGVVIKPSDLKKAPKASGKNVFSSIVADHIRLTQGEEEEPEAEGVPEGNFFQQDKTNQQFYTTDEKVHRVQTSTIERKLPDAEEGEIMTLPDPDGTALKARWQNKGKGNWVSLASREEYEQLKPNPPPPPPPVFRSKDPLVMNLRGEPMVFSGPKNQVTFDVDADGKKEFTGWPVGTYDALLVMDRNNNTVIDNGTELFGMTANSPQENGFKVLAVLDSNHDGVINSSDSDWSKLRLWFDKVPYGTTQSNELVPLNKYNVLEFDLNYKSDQQSVDSHGNLLREYSTFTRKDGKGNVWELPIVNVWFRSVAMP